MTPEPGPLTKLAQSFQEDSRQFHDELSATMRLISSDPGAASQQFPALLKRAEELEKRDREILSQMGDFGKQSLPASCRHWNNSRVRIILSQAMASMILARYPDVKALIVKGRQMMMEPRDNETAAAFDELEVQLISMTEV
jgi:hypothetical protein